MRKTIKYLENGEYHYATVKDVGDLAKLKTDSKEDLVAAINDLFINGGENAGKPEGYDKLVEQLTNAIKEQQGIKDKIDTIEKNDSDQDAARKKEIEELRTQQAEERAKADQAYNELVKKVESDINEIVESNKILSSNLDTQTGALRNDLNQTKNELEQEKGKLYNASNQVEDLDNRLSTAELTVKQNTDSISQMATRSEMNLIDQSVKKQETELNQQADEIKLKASQSDLDSVTQKVTKNTSDLTIANDAISAISSKQIEQGQNQQAIETKVVENAEGIKQISTDLQSSNNKIEKFEGKLETTSHDLKTQYEQYTNNAIGKISDSSLNKILNSSFTVGDDHLTSWQNISDKVNVEEDGNGLMWARIIQTGQSSINPVGLTSNYFDVKQGFVTVSVDVKEGQSATVDDSTVLRIELYDENNKRLDFQDVSLEDLGLSVAILNDHNTHRGLYRYNIDRSDVKKMTVRGYLNKNGDLSFTNFSARLSSIDNGDYTPNPDDYDRQIVKMNTSIEQNAKEIKLKATSAEVDNKVEGITSGLDDKMWSIARSEMTAASDNFKIQVEKATKTLDINPNLYTGTADFSGTKWVNKQSWVDDGTTDPEGNTALKNTSQAWDGLGQMYDVEVGQYTFSCWLMLSDDSNVSDGVMLFAGTGSLGETAQIDSHQGQGPTFQFGDETAKWQKVTWTFNVVISGWLYVRPELKQNTGTIRVGSYKLEKGDVATRWCQNTRELVTVNNVISSINVSPEEIKLASNKIVLDGDTTIKDTLNVGNVVLDGGNNGAIQMGDGKVKIKSTGNNYLALDSNGVLISDDESTSKVEIGKQYISLAVKDGTYMTMNPVGINIGNIVKNRFINSGIISSVTGSFTDQGQTPGIGLLITPENSTRTSNGKAIVIGEIKDDQGNIRLGMDYKIAANRNGQQVGQFNWTASHNLYEDGGVIKPTSDSQDDLFITSVKLPATDQPDTWQPAITLVHGRKDDGSHNVSRAGIQLQWDNVVPYGRMETSNFFFAPNGAWSDGGQNGLAINWVQWSGWEGRVPTIQRVNKSGREMANGGLAFFSWGGIVYWDGAQRWNLDWALNHTDGNLNPNDHGQFTSHL